MISIFNMGNSDIIIQILCELISNLESFLG